MLSHMQTMLVVFHSRGLVLTWMRTDAGERESTSPSRVTTVTGARQQAQYDSRRTSFPAKGGMRESATDSMAQPAKVWKAPSSQLSIELVHVHGLSAPE